MRLPALTLAICAWLAAPPQQQKIVDASFDRTARALSTPVAKTAEGSVQVGTGRSTFETAKILRAPTAEELEAAPRAIRQPAPSKPVVLDGVLKVAGEKKRVATPSS